MAKRQGESQCSATDFALEHPPYPLAARERVGRKRALPGVDEFHCGLRVGDFQNGQNRAEYLLLHHQRIGFDAQ